MTPPVSLKTPRLVLREFADDDVAAVQAYAADAEVVRHLDWGPNTPEDTAGFLALARATRDAVPRRAYHLALHRIWATYDVDNHASARVLEKLGMRREGHLRQSTRRKGEWRDSYLYAVLQPEWRGG
jgi:RimJ/RimL family protein N-acetyltransferase